MGGGIPLFRGRARNCRHVRYIFASASWRRTNEERGWRPLRRNRDAVRFARSVLEDPTVELPPAVTLDVGRIASRGWAVIETNPAWASGLYGCDPKAFCLYCNAPACRVIP